MSGNESLLQYAVLVPLALGIVLICGRRLPQGLARAIALVGFALPCIVALWLWWSFGAAPRGPGGYAYYSTLSTGMDAIGIALKLGLNGISVPLFGLAGIVGLAAGICGVFSKADRLPTYLGLLLVMQSGLMGLFASIDIFFLYFFHEFALIPTFIMIGLWGGQGRRMAAMEMTVYLTVGAMISLLGLIAIYVMADLGSFDLLALRAHFENTPMQDALQRDVFGLLLFGFGILVSLFPFHSWAPRGYAAAPTSAAMLHAGVLKKFGLYALIQVAMPLLPQGAASWSVPLAWLALGNLFLLGLVTIAQRDLKQMIGYSSVQHMGACFLGIACLSVIGVGGAVIMMFAHGLSVALMFLLATAIYQRTRTYDMAAMGGLCQKAPVLAGFFVAATMASVGLPGFANFWGEITIFSALWNLQPWMLFPAVASVVISAIYGTRAAARVFFGEPTDEFKARFEAGQITDIRPAERIPALILLAALFAVGFWPQAVSGPVGPAIEANFPATIVSPSDNVAARTPSALPVAGSATSQPTAKL